MFRKMKFALLFIIILSLMGSGMAFAKKGDYPTWIKAFDPGPYFGEDYHVTAIEEFKGDLYATVGSYLGGQIWHSPDGNNWTPATDKGFGVGEYEDNWDMAVFQDQLYILPFDYEFELPGQILRSADGITWESVVPDSFGLSYTQFHNLGVFKGMLYVNTGEFDWDAWDFDGKVWRSASGDLGTWEEVAEFPGMAWPGSFYTFKGALYLVSGWIFDENLEMLPSQIWRSYDGMNWSMVVADGFGNPGNNNGGGFAKKNGYLYIGMGDSDPRGGGIWRTRDGLAWEPVVEDGFGNPLNVKIDGLVTYKNNLYAYTDNREQGCMVYRSKDGKSWVPVNEPGWGDPTNWTSHLDVDQTIFKGELYMGIFGYNGGIMKLVHPHK